MLVLLLSDPQSWIDRPEELREVLHRALIRQVRRDTTEVPLARGARLALESVFDERWPEDAVVVSDLGWWQDHIDEMVSALDVAARLTAGDALETALDAAADAAQHREVPKTALDELQTGLDGLHNLPGFPLDSRADDSAPADRDR